MMRARSLFGLLVVDAVLACVSACNSNVGSWLSVKNTSDVCAAANVDDNYGRYIAVLVDEEGQRQEQMPAEATWIGPSFVDTSVQLNDPSQIPRRGSMALSLLNWLPQGEWWRHWVTLIVGSLLFSHAKQEGLGGETSMLHLLEPQGMREYFNALDYEAAIREESELKKFIVAVESTTFLAPSGQDNNVAIFLSEAQWLASRGAKVITYAGGELISEVQRMGYFAQLSRLGDSMRGVRWSAAFTSRDMAHVQSWARRKEGSFHMRKLEWIAKEAPHQWLLEILIFHPELWIPAKLADRFPRRTIVVNNAGGPFLCGRPLLKCDKYIEGLRKLANRPNVVLKLSGFGSPVVGLGYAKQKPNIVSVVEDWGPLIKLAVEHFGEKRVIFGSNFPLETTAVPPSVYWAAVKQVLGEGFSAEALQRLLVDNAKELYDL